LREFLDIFCIVYIDDILIFSNSKEEHAQHLQAILKKLAKAGLFIKGEKCKFFTTSTSFLGFIVSLEGISMDLTKVATIQDWKAPSSVKELQLFLGFANFYWRFIKNYSLVCRPLFLLL
jgi:hypothetical protein